MVLTLAEKLRGIDPRAEAGIRQKQAEEAEAKKSPKQKCLERGPPYYWDDARQACLIDKTGLPTKAEQEAQQTAAQPQQPTKLTPEERFKAEQEGSSIITDKFGNERIQTAEDLKQEKADVLRLGEGRLTKEQEAQQQAFLAQGQQLAGQVGQFNQLGVSPTGLNYGEAATAGIVGAIPRALSLAATGAGVGLVGGTAVAPGIGTASGAAIGAVAGFVSGIASSMISNFRSQRTDTTNAQKRVLDEGKQNMNDLATMAASDPANRQYYLAQYNKQAALIDQAYRQMILDTRRDVARFETALPDLAEFEAFYNTGGERDVLSLKMQTALASPTNIDYEMLELAQRRGTQ